MAWGSERRLRLGVAFVVFVAAGGVVLLMSQGNEDQGDVTAGSDSSARFASYEAAVEPDGDLSKVVWPKYVRDAGPEIKRLYEFQVENGDLMRYMPCFCGCGGTAGHRSNRDCYVRKVNADGSVVFDPMAPT